jgi:hypothetical protein
VPLLAVGTCRATVADVCAPGTAGGKPAVGDRNYTEATKSALFALSAKCYYPECKQPSVKLFGEEPEKNVHVAHIRAAKPGGSRYDYSMSREERDSFANLILLCTYHHRDVDKKANENRFPVEMLREWKLDAEKDLRAKVDGLDRLTEDRLNQMLTEAAHCTKKEIAIALDELSAVSKGSAELLRSLFEKIERHYIDSESIAMLHDASQRLYYLEEGSHRLYAASLDLGNLEENSHRLAYAADQLVGLEIGSLLMRFEEFVSDYAHMLHSKPKVPDISGSIELAAESLIAKVERKVASINLAEPVTVINDQQRWKFAAWGFVAGVVAVLITVVILAANHAF